jgi:hypothetical protein
VQVGPTSSTATPLEPRRAVVLNLLSNSLSVIDAKLVMGDEFDLEPLLEYRHAAVEAFADWSAGSRSTSRTACATTCWSGARLDRRTSTSTSLP